MSKSNYKNSTLFFGVIYVPRDSSFVSIDCKAFISSKCCDLTVLDADIRLRNDIKNLNYKFFLIFDINPGM